jgi:hypothetical protein
MLLLLMLLELSREVILAANQPEKRNSHGASELSSIEEPGRLHFKICTCLTHVKLIIVTDQPNMCLLLTMIYVMRWTTPAVTTVPTRGHPAGTFAAHSEIVPGMTGKVIKVQLKTKSRNNTSIGTSILLQNTISKRVQGFLPLHDWSDSDNKKDFQSTVVSFVIAS